MSTIPYAAYQRVQNAADDPRSIEYRLLAQVTAALIDSERDSKDTPKMVENVLWNRRVWAAFKVDLLSPNNQLPLELRGKLISLALFVERETAEILAFKADLAGVISVNKLVMEGLRPKATASQPAAQSAMAASAA